MRILLPLLLLGVTASAQTVSEQQAAERALSFLNQGPLKARGQSVTNDDLVLSHKAEREGETYYYIFNQPQSEAFVIVAGDERATQILGYGDHGCIDFEQAPANFRWWLSQYEDQIHQAIRQGLPPASIRQAAPRYNDKYYYSISDLIQTQWGQNKPYCNVVNAQGEGNEYVTGCVATAMAQIMKSHAYPTQGKGQHQYTTKQTKDVFSADFASTTYDWANMLNVYRSGEYNDVEADAVATLMYHAGVAVDMDYDTNANGGSAAYSQDIPHAMIDYFGYDKSALYLSRAYYTDEEWFDLVWTEIAHRRPVFYGGDDANDAGGHQFICHGYDATTDKFAFNWGWNGRFDGKYALNGVDALAVDISETQHVSFTKNQDIVAYVMPDQGNDYQLSIINAYKRTEPTAFQPIMRIASDEVKWEVTIDRSAESADQDLRYHYFPMNNSVVSQTFLTCILLRDVLTGKTIYCNQKYTLDLRPQEYIKQGLHFDFNTSLIQYNGTYEVIPAYRASETDEWIPVRMPVSYRTPRIIVTGAEDRPVCLDVIDFRMSNHGYFTPNFFQLYVTLQNNTGRTLEDYNVKLIIEPLEPFEVPEQPFVIIRDDTYSPIEPGESLGYDISSLRDGYNDIRNFFGGPNGDLYLLKIIDSNDNLIAQYGLTLCRDIEIPITITKAGWATICLPFEAEIPEGITAYSITGTRGNSLIREVVSEEKFEMNTPYLLSYEDWVVDEHNTIYIDDNYGILTFCGPDTPTKESLRSGLLVGNTLYHNSYAPAGSYVLQMIEGDLGFYKVETDYTQPIRSYSAYVQLPEDSSVRNFSLSDPDGIQKVFATPSSSAATFRIDGTRAHTPSSGLLIRNGRIVFER